jgi:hypothetical protein
MKPSSGFQIGATAGRGSLRGRIGSLSGVVDEIRGLAQRPPLPVGRGARTLGFRRGTNGVTPKQEPHRRFIETRDVQDGRRRLLSSGLLQASRLRVAGLRAIVLALKPRDGSERRGIGGIVRENGLGVSREVRAEAPGLDDGSALRFAIEDFSTSSLKTSGSIL